jgi:hypothetical protein
MAHLGILIKRIWRIAASWNTDCSILECDLDVCVFELRLGVIALIHVGERQMMAIIPGEWSPLLLH